MRYTARSANTQPIRRIHQNLNEMKILIVASDKGGHFAPFIEEQLSALQALGVQIIRYGVTRKGITGYLRELPALRRLIRAERPDIIHAHYGLSGLLANLQRRVPVVTTYHGSDINKLNILRFSRIAMRLSAYNIFVSQRNIAIAQPKNKYVLLPCGVNIPQPWNELQTQLVGQLTLNQWVYGVLKPDVKHILFAGAFDNAVKDPSLAKDAIAFCNRPIELIELKGYNRDQVNTLMYNCDVLLLTSKTEGSPQVIKEAMACGCPIVSVDVGDVAERTSGVEGCYLVRTREPKDIADALLQAIAFDGRTNGRQRILEMELSNEQVAEQLLRIYEQLLV